MAVLTGSNADETTLWGYGDVDDDKLLRRAEALDASEVLATYRRTRPGADAAALLIALTTDHMFRMPAVRLAEGIIVDLAAGLRCISGINDEIDDDLFEMPAIDDDRIITGAFLHA